MATSSLSRAYSRESSWARALLSKTFGSLKAASTSVRRRANFSTWSRKSIIGAKNNPPARGRPRAGGKRVQSLLLFLFGFGGGGLGCVGFGHALLELVHATSGIDELLLAGIEGMADVANTDQNHRLGGAGLNHVAASATDFRFLIFRMNVSFHKNALQVNRQREFDKDLLEKFCRHF